MKPYGSKRQDSGNTLGFEKDQKYNLGVRDIPISCQCKRCKAYRERRKKKTRNNLTKRNASRSLKKRARQQSKKLCQQ